MRIGMLSSPMLLQRDAGLHLQIRETARALSLLGREHGIELSLELADTSPRCLAKYDVIHVFSSAGGRHGVVEAAAERGLPVVLSPQIAGSWDRSCGAQARHADRALDLQMDGDLHSSYAQTRHALQLASLIVALSNDEKRAIEEGFLIAHGKVKVLSVGVNQRMFDADGSLFRLRTGIHGPFVLMDGAISPYHNQLGMAHALADLSLPFVLLGEARERDQDYLHQVRAVGGVTCLGGLRQDSSMLASAYAAATVLVLPAQGEASARTALDALAAGTPVVTGASCPVDILDSEFALRQLAWNDVEAQQQAVRALASAPPSPASVRALVRPMTWERVALQLAACYRALLDGAGDEAQGLACRVSASYTAV